MCHAMNPEIWFRPNDRISLASLLERIGSGGLIATPRLGVRDRMHPKGYAIGQQVTLRVLCVDGSDQLVTDVVVENLCIKPLRRLTKQDLFGTVMYDDWRQIQSDLSGFEGKALDGEEMVTIVTFSYAVPSVIRKEKPYVGHQVAC